MKATELKRTSRVVRGQTLIMAMIILGIMLILGLVFVGIVNRNITGTGTSRTRGEASDLAEAGVRYVHSQMLNSVMGADWRGTLTILNDLGGNFTRDPDALYLRPGTGFGMRSDTDPQIDLGGPDGLGPYVRVTFANGRALVRARYTPSDFNVFSSSPTGSLLNPGKARAYTIIESVGRPGVINDSDPTTLLGTAGIQYQGFAGGGAFRSALGVMRNRDNQIVQSRKVIAFASIGIIEDALYITNVDNVSVPAELGCPNELNVFFQDNANNPDQPVRVPLTLGSTINVYDVANPPTASANPMPYGGSIYSNAALLLHGDVKLNLNKYLGDRIIVADTVIGSDDKLSTLSMQVADWTGTPGSWQVAPYPPLPLTVATNTTNPSIDSRNANFWTDGGMFRDGLPQTDFQGNPRSAPRKEPPSIDRTDPSTGLNRYRALVGGTGNDVTGSLNGITNDPNGIYVGNTYDRQIRVDPDGRADVGSAESLVFDWLNPNNGQEGSGWKGPFYVPTGAYVQLTQDGFTISLDGSNRPPNSLDNQRTWVGSGLTTLRFRIGDVAGVPYIINTLTPNAGINTTSPDFTKGVPFSGVLFFEGNVRIRGIIPTDRQMTVVSMATIYVEGSITKGVLDASGARLHRPSRSMLMLMAKDYVAINTSEFFGPRFGQTLEEVNEAQVPWDWDPVRLKAGNGTLNLGLEFLLDPNNPATNPNDPSTQRPFMQDYNEFTGLGGNNGPALNTQLLLSHAADDYPAQNAFVTLDIDFGIGQSSYLFALTPANAATAYYPANYVTPGYTTPNFAPIYGLGVNAWQVYSKFESASFPIWDRTNATANVSAGTIAFTGGPEGLYTFLINDTTELLLNTTSMAPSPTNDYLLARVAVVPHDIRIEAAMYAEQGSFFVIPGHWFNPNRNDTREAYTGLGATQAERDAARQIAYGSSPATPFYGEPLDVRVSILGAVSENMPPPSAQQSEWLRKWGWIPRDLGASGRMIPWSHVPAGYDISNNPGNANPNLYVPNLVITYDPALATGRSGGFDPTSPYLRTDTMGRPLPPMPRLPVSPTLSYFGEVNP